MVRIRVRQDLRLAAAAAATARGPDVPVEGPLHLKAGRLATAQPSDRLRIEGLVRQALAGDQTATCTLPRSGQLPLTVAARLASPVNGESTVELDIRDPHRFRLSAPLLQQLFELTPAEAAVVARLATGRHPPQIATELGVQPNTVAAHLKRALAKTGAGRQAALVALVLGSVACEGTPEDIACAPAAMAKG